MGLLISCPSCRATCRVEAEHCGKQLRCGKCGKPFLVPPAAPPRPAGPPARPSQAIKGPRPAPPATAPAATARPGSAPSRPQTRPPQQGRPRRGETEGEPRRSRLPLILALAGGGGLALVVLVVVLVIALGSGDGPQAAAPPEGNGQLPLAAAAEPPPGPAPAHIDPATVQRVKRSTAYLHVTLHNGETAEGSGFFGAEPGIVLTNAHVLGMLHADGRRPR